MWKVVNQTKEFKSYLDNLRKIRIEIIGEQRKEK